MNKIALVTAVLLAVILVQRSFPATLTVNQTDGNVIISLNTRILSWCQASQHTPIYHCQDTYVSIVQLERDDNRTMNMNHNLKFNFTPAQPGAIPAPKYRGATMEKPTGTEARWE
jgi:hypothetical protein